MLAEENKNPGPSALDGKVLLLCFYSVYVFFTLHL